MRLFRFKSGETDYVAAETLRQAVDVYMREYGLGDRDLDGVAIDELDPNNVEVFPDGWDYDSDDEPPTAADVMAEMKRPGLVASSAA